ncbi:MAG: TOBE domain-containing protein, partial [Alphaproteobacteria bacterium]
FVAQFIGENNTFPGTVVSVSKNVCTVEVAGGIKVKAIAANIEGPGKDTTLSLRPELVEINPKAKRLSNRLDGRIEELIYLGDHIRVRMSVAGHDEFIVKVPNKQAHETLREKDAVTVGWATNDCRALDPIARL